MSGSPSNDPSAVRSANSTACVPGTQGGDRWGRPRGDALAAVGYPSIWLIFMFFPLTALINSEAGFGAVALGAAAFTTFCLGYAASWWWTTLLPNAGSVVNTVAWFAVLVLTALAMAPAIGANVLSTGPFLIAVLAFRLPLRQAAVGLLVLVTVYVTIAFRLGDPFVYWVPAMMLGSTILMLAISALIDREERALDTAHDLDMARQRETIGRDVHDLLGHSLTVITVKTELARKLLDRDPERAAAELDEVLALSREALSEVRATVGQLRSPEWSAQLASARTALRAARIDAKLPSPAVDIPEPQKQLLAWCLREAVTNVIRHSQATRCVVEAGPGSLVVTDDGVGTPQHFERGNGLRGMADRVREAGGSLRVGPRSDTDEPTGTRLEVTLP